MGLMGRKSPEVYLNVYNVINRFIRKKVYLII